MYDYFGYRFYKHFVIKHPKAKFVSDQGPWDKIVSNVALWSNLCFGVLNVKKFVNHWI